MSGSYWDIAWTVPVVGPPRPLGVRVHPQSTLKLQLAQRAAARPWLPGKVPCMGLWLSGLLSDVFKDKM